jgi:hypothetical protein
MLYAETGTPPLSEGAVQRTVINVLSLATFKGVPAAVGTVAARMRVAAEGTDRP